MLLLTSKPYRALMLTAVLIFESAATKLMGGYKMFKIVTKLLMFFFFSVSVAMYSFASEEDTVTYEKDIKKIISDKCLSCHGSDSPSFDEFEKDKERFKKKNIGPRMDTYENLVIFVNGKDAGSLMRRLDDGKNTKDGKPGNMYMYLGSEDPETPKSIDDAEKAKSLEIMKKWVGSWSLKRRSELTDSELKAVKVPKK